MVHPRSDLDLEEVVFEPPAGAELVQFARGTVFFRSLLANHRSPDLFPAQHIWKKKGDQPHCCTVGHSSSGIQGSISNWFRSLACHCRSQHPTCWICVRQSNLKWRATCPKNSKQSLKGGQEVQFKGKILTGKLSSSSHRPGAVAAPCQMREDSPQEAGHW